jgi:hypothetical protein
MRPLKLATPDEKDGAVVPLNVTAGKRLEAVTVLVANVAVDPLSVSVTCGALPEVKATPDTTLAGGSVVKLIA